MGSEYTPSIELEIVYSPDTQTPPVKKAPDGVDDFFLEPPFDILNAVLEPVQPLEIDLSPEFRGALEPPSLEAPISETQDADATASIPEIETKPAAQEKEPPLQQESSLPPPLPETGESTVILASASQQEPATEPQAEVVLEQATRVDLGDDLLQEKTVVLSSAIASSSAQAEAGPGNEIHVEELLNHSSPEDLIQSARILMNEGMLEDAKKALHRALISDRRNALAEDLLHEIHEEELKQILGAGEDKPKHRWVQQRREVREEDSDRVFRDLDADLGLGLASGEFQLPSMFRNQDDMKALSRDLERSLIGAAAEDRIDLGVGLLEMGFHDLAIDQFSAAAREIELARPDQQSLRMGAIALIAQAYLLSARPLEATLAMHAPIKDVEIAPSHKIELFYLMGRAQEALGKRPVAVQWYSRVKELDPRYRDVEDRLRKGGA